MNLSNLTPSGSYAIERIVLQTNKELTYIPQVTLLIWNPSHSISISVGKEKEKIIDKGQIFFLPQAIPYSFYTTKDTFLLSFSLPSPLSLFHTYIGKERVKQKEFFHSFTLSTGEMLERFFVSTDIYLSDDLMGATLSEIKTRELFCLLKLNFSSEELASFFAPIFSESSNLYHQVLSNYTKVRTIQELARNCGLSLSSFHRLFVRSFGTTPYKWMLQKKAHHLYEEIHHSYKPFKKIAEENGFSSIPQFIDFCKRHLGATPGEIRSGKKNPVFMR